MTPVPILFYGDSPGLKTGLGRIGRDLAVIASAMPQYRVGYFGRGGTPARKLPFIQYCFDPIEQWGERQIEHVWNDFAGDVPGVIMTIWDASRLLWFARPEGMPAGTRSFLESRRFLRWGYFPVDATGVNDRLTQSSRAAIAAYDRPLAYTIWGSQVIERSIGRPVDWIPHGYNNDLFTPRDRTAARMAMGFRTGDTVLGCVMSNQPRKDWGLAFSVAQQLKNRIPSFRFWAHVDVLERSNAWNLHALIADFGMQDCTRVTISGDYSDEQLSYGYSACDLTMLPSLGEGFGYPLVESMGCGVPVLHGDYAGGSELIPDATWKVPPVSWRLEGIHNCLRPVYDPAQWVSAALGVLERKPTKDLCRSAVSHLEWPNLHSVWKRWFEEGLC